MLMGWLCMGFPGFSAEPGQTEALPSIAAEAPPAPSSPVPATPTPSEEPLILPANTLVHVELLEEVSTLKSKPDDFFVLKVASPVYVRGQVVIPTGAEAVGQVIDSQKKGLFGNPAKLLIAIRHAKVARGTIPLRFYGPYQGEDKTKTATGLAFVPVLGLFSAFMKGGEVVLAPGTRLVAKVARDIPLKPTALVIPTAATGVAVSPKGSNS